MENYKYYNILSIKNDISKKYNLLASNTPFTDFGRMFVGDDQKSFPTIEALCDYLGELNVGKGCKNLEYFRKEYRFRAYGKEFSDLSNLFKGKIVPEAIEIFYVNDFDTYEKILDVSREDMDNFGDEFYWNKVEMLNLLSNYE